MTKSGCQLADSPVYVARTEDAGVDVGKSLAVNRSRTMPDYDLTSRVRVTAGDHQGQFGLAAYTLRCDGVVWVSVCLRASCYEAGECRCETLLDAPLVPGNMLEVQRE